jgi:hypothetical protein
VHSADLAGPLPWPDGRDFVTMCDAFQRQLRAQRTRVSRRPLHVNHVTRDRAIGQGVDTDGNVRRLKPLGPSRAVADVRTAAVESAAAYLFERCKLRSAIGLAESGGGLVAMRMAPASSRLMAVTILKR